MTDKPEDPYYFTINNAEISIDDDGWLNYDDLQKWLLMAIKNEEFSILLTNDEHIQNLNRDFRAKDKPTNVLSFPDGENGYLGDIAISLNTIEAEAQEQNKDFYHHFIHMVIHGLLHLQGHDHEDDSEAEKMESLETQILADMGIETPYI